jgi:hypothetical protein
MYGHDEIRELLGVTQQDLERSFLGDIGGVLLPRKDGAVAADGVVKGIETHWVGMRYAELQAAATRAAARKAPGVVVLAIGANKVDVLASAIRRGLVNHVFIDQDLARATEQVLQRLLPQPARGESIGELVDGHARQE